MDANPESSPYLDRVQAAIKLFWEFIEVQEQMENHKRLVQIYSNELTSLTHSLAELLRDSECPILFPRGSDKYILEFADEYGVSEPIWADVAVRKIVDAGKAVAIASSKKEPTLLLQPESD